MQETPGHLSLIVQPALILAREGGSTAEVKLILKTAAWLFSLQQSAS
jgi:hypothetical protein